MKIEQVPIITLIYAACEEHEELLYTCVGKVRSEFPDNPHYMGIDKASENFRMWAKGRGFILYEPEIGNPPRVKMIYRKILAQIKEPFFFIVEQDNVMSRVQGQQLLGVIKDCNGDVASVGPRTIWKEGRTNFPTNLNLKKRRTKAYPHPRHKLVQTILQTFNCSIWRRHLWNSLQWDKISDFPRTDTDISRQLIALGHVPVSCPSIRVLHFPHSSRREIEKPTNIIVERMQALREKGVDEWSRQKILAKGVRKNEIGIDEAVELARAHFINTGLSSARVKTIKEKVGLVYK